MGKSESKLKSLLKYAGYLVLAFIIGFPHLVLARYTIPGADDFSCANAVEIYRQNHNVFASALAYTRDVYQTVGKGIFHRYKDHHGHMRYPVHCSGNPSYAYHLH